MDASDKSQECPECPRHSLSLPATEVTDVSYPVISRYFYASK